MKLFGINIGGKAEDDSKKAASSSSKVDVKGFAKKIVGHQLFLAILLISTVLALTTIQMLGYSDPPIDEQKAQENVSKLKRIIIDEDVVSQINDLKSSNATVAPNVDNSRTNPFTE